MSDKDTIVNALSDEDQAAMQPETFVNPMVKALLGGAAANAAVPGKLMQQNPYPPGSEANILFEDSRQKGMEDWSNHNALTMMGSGAPFAQSGAAGIFGGRLAQTADLDKLKFAEQMHERGFPQAQIWDATGWYKHPADNKWRFEIPDNNMKLNYMPTGEGDMAAADLSSWINHPEALKAYPFLGKIKTQVTKQAKPATGLGVYDNPSTASNPNQMISISAVGPTSDVVRSVLAHEMQHGAQNMEHFSYGGSPEDYRNLIDKGLDLRPDLLPTGTWQQKKQQLMDIFGQAYPLYRKTAGEVEARNVQKRLDWTPEQRRITPPWESQDTPYSQQINNDPWGAQRIIRALQQ